MLTLDGHPHARAVLGAALKDEPAHAYLLHGPAGSGKRERRASVRRASCSPAAPRTRRTSRPASTTAPIPT